MILEVMEALMDDQNVSVVVSQCSGERGTLTNAGGNGVVRTSATAVSNVVRSNGPSLTSPSSVKQEVSSSTTTQAFAVPSPGGTVSIVHLSIPSQSVHAPSVIQQSPNQQSVIQAPSSTIQSLSKNVIFLNKNVGSVIQSTEGEAVHHLQLISAKGDSDGNVVTVQLGSSEEDSKKRRELLARRPSYRKILHDLSAADSTGAVGVLTAAGQELKEETVIINGDGKANDQSSDNDSGTITVGGTQYHTAGLLKVVPAASIQLSSQDGLQGLQTLTVANSGNGNAGSIVQYAQGQDGHIFVPVTVSTDLHAYQIRSATSSPNSSLSQNVVMTSSGSLSPHHVAEEASRKRELRLLKNREAAKECRRKKKEYIKCLENRVAVLENQNKALIDELKSLKELYCQKND